MGKFLLEDLPDDLSVKVLYDKLSCMRRKNLLLSIVTLIMGITLFGIIITMLVLKFFKRDCCFHDDCDCCDNNDFDEDDFDDDNDSCCANDSDFVK